MDTELMGSEECAKMLGVQVATLQQWRTRHTGPPWAKVGAKVLYLRKNVMEWLDKEATKNEIPKKREADPRNTKY